MTLAQQLSPHIKFPFFLMDVRAGTAEDALRVSGAAAVRKRYLMVPDSVSDVRKAVLAKKKRVSENMGLYGDKLREYEGVLNRLLEREAESVVPADFAKVVALGMLEHGDSRVDVRDACCVIQVDGSTQWLVFGYIWS